MIERLAVDANAIIDWLRASATDPPPLRGAKAIVVPLPVLGELYAGAFLSIRREENLSAIDAVLAKHAVLRPDEMTARTYGEIRGRLGLKDIGQSKKNDLWIAALCIQHDLPLLTRDDGFDAINGLTVIHW